MNALERMFQVLVRTLRERNPALLTAPFTVGELHSQILPYRHFRRELGLETNQQYEMVLMELLTGAGGFLDVDERLRDELGKELASGHPEPSRVREFADAHVSVNAAAQARVPEACSPSPAKSSTPQAMPATPRQPRTRRRPPRRETRHDAGTAGATFPRVVTDRSTTVRIVVRTCRY